MTVLEYVAFFILVFRTSVHCAAVFDPSPSNSTVLEGGTASFTCVPKENGSVFHAVWLINPVASAAVTVVFPGNSTIIVLPGADQVIQSGNRTQLTIIGVQRSLDGASVECRRLATALLAPLVYIIVQRPPNFTLPELSTDVLEGQALNLTLENVDFGNSEGAVSVLFEGRVLSKGSEFTINRSGSTWSLEFPALNRSDAGVYRVLLNNTVGSSGMNFTVNVVFPPEFTFPTVRSVQLNSGSPFTFDCTASAANPSSVDYSFHVNGSSQPLNVSGANLTISSVVRADTGNYSCTATNTVGSTTLYHNLLVVEIPEYTTRNDQSPNANESVISYTYEFNLNPEALPANFTWTKDGTSLSTDDLRFTLAVDSITIGNVNRSDSGNYTVRATNIAGMGCISFVLDVHYPPEFTFPTVRSVQLNSGSQFTFDCTASAANPSSVDYNFRKDGSSQPFSVSGPVLTISLVVRANTGNYSCTANNTVGSSITVYYNLLVVAPPTSPLNLMVSGEMAFSAMVTWTPPTGDGGISHPSWTPPSPSSSPIVQYAVTYSNSRDSWNINNLNTPLVTLSNLQHSTDYTVTVAASNAYGVSRGVQGTFRTLDSKPILQAVVLAPLSLNNFTANVTFLTVGGQDVTNFAITINDSSPAVEDSTPVPDGKGVMVSLLIEGQSFTKGTYYTVEITATNSVGTSERITGLMFVPNAPNITGNFTDVSADSIPSTKCCAGIQLMLADRVVLSDLNVVFTPTVPSASLELQYSTLYIGGVQAGTDYTAVVTVSNIFGSSPEQHLELKPLLGVPSNPNPPTVSVNGGQVTVDLSTAYPGTVQTRSGSMFRFEIQFIEDGQRSSRQSKNVTHSVIPPAQSQDLNTTVRASYVDNLDPGSYSVSVTAVNEHGQSSAVMSQSTFTVTVTPAPEGSVTIIIIIVIIVVVVVVLVLIVLIMIIAIISFCIICCMRAKKNKKEKYHVGSEDTELTANRNAVEKNSLDGDRDSLFIETGMYDVVGKETIKPPKPQSTPASTTNGQPQPGGDVYAEVNKPKKTNEAAATPTTPPTEDMYEAVDMSKKTKKPKTEAPADKVDPEATLYAEVVQEKKEPAVPPKTEAECQNPEVDKPIEENELQYATLDFSKAPSSFKKPAPPNPDENVIYSQVTIAKKQ